MKKLFSLLIYLLIGISLPLGLNPGLIFHYKILLVIIACALIIFTQPSMDFGEARNRTQTDKHSFWFILILSIIGIAAPVLEWGLSEIGIQNSLSVFSITGITILFIGIILRVWAIKTLGSFFTATVQITENHSLIKHGPYRNLRHPSYTGSWLAFLGVGLWLESFVGLMIAITCMTLAYYLRIKAEEQTLLKTFGQQYISYQKKTFRMIPLVW